MKKETKKSILFYAASALLYMASLISFISGNDNSMAVVWLCLGSSFLCLGSTHLCLGLSRKKKGCIFSEPAKLLNFLTTDGSKDTGF